MKEVLFKDVKVGGTFRFGLDWADMVKVSPTRYAHKAALIQYSWSWRGMNFPTDLSNLPCHPDEKVFSGL